MTFVIVMGFHQIIVLMNDIKRHTYCTYIHFKDCRGQAYDGTGNVAGHLSGLSARLLVLN